MQDRKISNQRNTTTKKKVQDALLTLLEQKEIDKVTIKELCDLADINRTTFYNHYGSQYDVLQEIVQTYLEHTALMIQDKMAAGDDFKECFIDALQYMKKHTKFLQLLFSQKHFQLLSGINICLPQFDGAIMNRQPADRSPQRKKAMAIFIQQGIIGILVDWIRSGCRESAEEMAELILFTLGTYS